MNPIALFVYGALREGKRDPCPPEFVERFGRMFLPVAEVAVP